jgi:CRP/FNR family cyclic AMP-dependent transcriptional regulator
MSEPAVVLSSAAIDSAGYVAASLTFLAFYTKTMLPLRYIAISSNVAFIVYGALAQLNPVLLLHCVLLPLNLYRLRQLRRLISNVSVSASSDFSVEWLLPYMKRQRARAGDRLFRSGDRADRMFYIVSGTVSLPEAGVERSAGDVIGEIGLFSPVGQRTTSAHCSTDCELLVITDRQVFDLYYQNPKFGIFLLRLITGRLINEVDRLKQGV